MSITNSIVLTLNIKDENSFFSNNCVSEEKYKGLDSLIYEGTLTHDTPKFCPLCGCINDQSSIVKYGFKTSYIRIPSISKKQAVIKLHKQRFFCRSCSKSFLAITNIVQPRCSISSNTRLSILLDAKKKYLKKILLRITLFLMLLSIL